MADAMFMAVHRPTASFSRIVVVPQNGSTRAFHPATLDRALAKFLADARGKVLLRATAMQRTHRIDRHRDLAYFISRALYLYTCSVFYFVRVAFVCDVNDG